MKFTLALLLVLCGCARKEPPKPVDPFEDPVYKLTLRVAGLEGAHEIERGILLALYAAATRHQAPPALSIEFCDTREHCIEFCKEDQRSMGYPVWCAPLLKDAGLLQYDAAGVPLLALDYRTCVELRKAKPIGYPDSCVDILGLKRPNGTVEHPHFEAPHH